MRSAKVALLSLLFLASPVRAEIEIGVPVTRSWNICLDEGTAKYVANQYKVSAEYAFSAWDYMETQGLCTYIPDASMTVVKPVYLVKGADGGTARVFLIKDELLEVYWLEVK